MAQLFRTPEGFLDLIGRRVGGRYPQEVADVAAPTIDATTLLEGRTYAGFTAASLTAAVGDQAVITVPNNETWVLHSVGIWLSVGVASELFAWRIYLENMPGADDPLNQFPISSYDGLGGTDPVHLTGWNQQVGPFALSPGVSIVGEVVDESQPARGWALQAGVCRLKGN